MLRRLLAVCVTAIVLAPTAASASSGWARYDADTWVRWHARVARPAAGENVTPGLRAELGAFLGARFDAVHRARAEHRAWLEVLRAAQEAARAAPASAHQAATYGAAGGRGGASGSVPGLIRADFSGGQVSTALCVAWRESRYNPNATNRFSGAMGVFQFMPSVWPSFSSRAGWGGSSAYSAAANVGTAAWVVAHEGWGPWGGGC